MISLDDLTPGARVRHIGTRAKGVVADERGRFRDWLRSSVAWTGDETDSWWVLVRFDHDPGGFDRDPQGLALWCLPDELEVDAS